jgi:hypothetical protein
VQVNELSGEKAVLPKLCASERDRRFTGSPLTLLMSRRFFAAHGMGVAQGVCRLG